LAIRNQWVLGPTVLEKVHEKTLEDEKKMKQAADKKALQSAKDTIKFREAFQRYATQQRLTTADYCTLLRHVKRRDNMLLASKVHDLMLQWEERKHGLDDYLANPLVDFSMIDTSAIIDAQ
jgi:hypothetical protein